MNDLQGLRGDAADAKQWERRARYDLGTARVMLDARRYGYVLFTCQQAAEKMLKALVVQRTGAFPPHTHNLLGLAELAGLSLGEYEKDFLARLQTIYTQTRYPAERPEPVPRIDRKRAASYLEETRRVFRWLKQQLT